MKPAGAGVQRKPILVFALVLFVLAMVFVLALGVGPTLSGARFPSFGYPGLDILQLRLIRVGTAAVVGAALAIAGVLLQALLRNPLADPYILGIANGATIGVMLWMLFGQTVGYALFSHGLVGMIFSNGQSVPAMLGALVTCVLVFLLGKKRGGNLDPIALLLSGVVLATINGALILLLNSLLPGGARSDIMDYLFGYISDGTPVIALLVSVLVLVVGWLIAVTLGSALDVASLSDVESESLGVRLSTLRTTCFVLAGVLTAAAIAISGPIGFVGLICPHICRALLGPSHRRLLLAAPCLGAAFLMAADAFVHGTGAWFNGELPVGVVTALCGGPFFLYLLMRRRTWD
jgi:iron complex transport system permease protein